MKKITFFIGSLEEGGAERVLSYLTSYLTEKEYEVLLVLYHDRELFYQLDPRVEVKFVTRETGSGNLIKNLCWLRRCFKENSAVVVSFLAIYNIFASLALGGTDVPLLVADRNDPRFVPTNKMLRYLRNFCYLFADGVIVQTQRNKQYFSRKIQNKSVVIYNPINLGSYYACAKTTPKENTIVSVGRLMPQKNQQMLVRAFAQLHQEFPEYKLVIYGEGPARTELELLIDQLGMAEHILLPGSEKNVFPKIAPAKLFVLSSNYEGMPNALAEAMCLGLPCISTAISGATDMIQSGENGLLVEPNNGEELKTAIRKVLTDHAFADSISAKALNLYEKLDWSIIAKQWMDYILSFCDRKENVTTDRR